MKYKLILWIMVILALSVSVLGATPVVDGASIDPNPAYTGDTLTYDINVSDADSDNMSQVRSIYKDGVLQGEHVLITHANLESWYPFDNDVLDYFGTNDATNVGATRNTTNTNINNSYTFNGTDYMTITEPFTSTTSARTVNVWFYAPSSASGTFRSILTSGVAKGRTSLSVTNANKVRGLVHDGGNKLDDTINIVHDQWNMATMTWNGTLLTAWLNGVASSSPTTTGTTLTTDVNWEAEIGRASNLDDREWIGELDELQFYNTALTGAEILELYTGSARYDDVTSGLTTTGEVWTLGVTVCDSGACSNETNATRTIDITITHKTPTTSEITQATPVTINSAVYVPVLTGSFAVNTTGTIDIGVTGDIEGLGGSTIATCRIVFDGASYQNKTSSPSNNQHKSFYLQSHLITGVAVGIHNVSFECRKDSTSRFLIESSELIVTEYYDSLLNPILATEFIINETQVSNSTYVLLGSYTHDASDTSPENSSFDKNLLIKSQINFEHVATGEATLIYDIGGANYSSVYRESPIGETGTGSFFAMYNMSALPTTNVTIKVYANAPTGTANLSLRTTLFEVLGHKSEFDANQNITTAVLTGTSWQTINTHNIEITSHSGVAIVSYASIVADTPSGSDDLSFRLILTGIENGSSVNRDIVSSYDGIITVDQDFLNLSSGSYTVELQALSTSGGSVSQVERVFMTTFTSNEVFAVVDTYTVTAFRQDTLAILSGFNVTIASSGSVFEDGASIVIPVTVSLENITVSLSGYNDNITLLHNTSTDLNVSLFYNLLAPSLILTLSPVSPITVGQTSTITGSSCPAELTCNLYRDGVNVSNPDIQNLSAGAYVYEYNVTGNINYSSETLSSTYYVNGLAPPVCSGFNSLKVVYNDSYTWNVLCSATPNISTISISCDDGYSLNLSPNSSSYTVTNSSNPILVNTDCTLNITDISQVSTIYTATLDPATGGELIYGSCPDTDIQMSMLWLLITITGFFILTGFVLGNPFIMIVGGILTLVSGWVIVDCLTMLGLTLILFSVLLLGYALSITFRS